ncbi:MAG: hypothetical protein N2999_03215 [Proteobacteria bacterium]|nr:hypothetical protein [Pseudomonadota bacterium]
MLFTLSVKKYLLILLALFIFSCAKEKAVSKDYLPVVKVSAKNSDFYQFIAKGGERHLSLIDWGEEAIPVSSKSCHHGGEVVPPLRGFLSASYDDKNIYLKVSWSDLTKDSRISRWKNGNLTEGKDDGISIIFSKSPDFNCALTCHMTNWEIDRGKFVSDYRMFNEKEENPITLLRSAKSMGRAVAGILGKDGKRNPKGGEFFVFNSKRAEGRVSSFYLYQILGKEDSPVFKDENLFILSNDNVYLDSKIYYKLNQWSSEISIPLDFLGLKEIKKGAKIYMAIALFDGTNVNHSMTETFSAVFE